METFVNESIKDIPVRGSTGELLRGYKARLSVLGFVRYADDFVFTHPELSVILFVKEKVKEFLTPIGLEISEQKTRITHTLEINKTNVETCPGMDGKPGFNFLGFYIRQHKTVHNSAKDRYSRKLGYHTVIIPSQEKRNTYQAKLHKIVLQDGKGYDQDVLIKRLNPVIRGWANYFGKSDANTFGYLTRMDFLLYLKLRKWAKRIKKTTGKGRSCFRKIEGNNWKFATQDNVLLDHISYSFPLSLYTKVKGDSSPFDPNQIYWAKRLPSNNTFNTRVTNLLKVQKGICTFCGEAFYHDDIMEVDHIIPKAQGGKDQYVNLQLLHRHCHDTKTSFE
jgi:RNA-directed DNA polymerase